jgi:D-alanyl-D-alanine carboxypeptidase
VAYRVAARTPTRRIRIRRRRVAALLVVGVLSIGGGLGYRAWWHSSSSPAAAPIRTPRALPGAVWPVAGQAAIQVGESRIQAGPNQHPAPIASVAKVMTAYVVLRNHPLAQGEDGPTISLTEADVADTERSRRQQESIVPVAAGEEKTERHAL